ncbi:MULTISPECIES: DUF4388 domain-containing protein [unclassified Deinococcus]|jgi:hypothetical protein|uniref:DUF4388 domain-containing protein n=1 Tax=unclassified Deinococcus TaxID=2623546 RepID=UPI001C88FF7F|nr:MULTISPECIES: DUF4388 domain-containing protein [unclassified Deinococcus]MBX8465405.1 DUF4388 domain-containing protein [Deinococcus sp. RIT780]MCD0166419.1 DUF4388 domain-containing protein [Deinococcus sp. 12RED42]MCD0177843.1 DUF4388 domain-containing protein [Deinococcus sp. 14RED07]
MVRGDLNVFPFLSVMQMFLTSGRSGRLSIDHVRGGQLWIDRGEIIHAEVGRLRGDPALQLLSSLDGGMFTFEADQHPAQRTLSLRRDSALRRMLEDSEAWTPLLRAFPDWNQRLRFTARWNEAQPVTRPQYRMLHLISDSTSVRALLERTQEPPRTALDTLRPFLLAGLIELV